jgi:hypothetical protein
MIRALIDHLWQSTLFGVAIWSITLALRSNSAAVRHWLWLLASLKFLVPFSALYLAGAAAGLFTPVETEPACSGRGAGRAPDDLAVAGARAVEGSVTAAARIVRAWALVALGLGDAMAAQLARCGSAFQGGAAGAGRIAGCARHGRGCRTRGRACAHPVVLLPSALLGRLSQSQLAP